MRPVTLAVAVVSTAILAAACSDASSPASLTGPSLAGSTPAAALIDARNAERATSVVLQSNPGTCLAVRTAIQDDQYVGWEPCLTGSPRQQWVLRTSGTVQLAQDPRWCLDIGGQRGNDGDFLAIGYCAGVTSQRWSVTTNGELKTQLASSGRCITAGSTASGNARMRSCGAYPTLQRWSDAGGTTAPAPTPTPVAVASVELAPALDTLVPGEAVTLAATARDANGAAISGRVVTWTSSNVAVASVSSSGAVLGVAPGTAAITATIDGVSARATIVVRTPPVLVASVTVSAPSTSVVTGGSLQLSAVARDAAGNLLSGRSTSWSSSNAGIATVSGSGVVNGVAAGTATITANVEGVTGRLTITVTAPPPSPLPGVGEPVPSANVLFRDSFDAATSAGSGYARRGTMSLVPGRNGGQAIRFHYTGGSADNLIEKQFAAASDFYMSYWYRTSPGADPTSGGRNGSGMKWLMLWRADGARYTNGVGLLDNGGPGSPQTGLEFTTHDNGSTRQPDPFLQNISKAKKFGNTNDGQWHRYTIHVVTGNGGYEQIWVDGVLVLDNRAMAYDHQPGGIGMIQLPGLVVGGVPSGWEFTIDIDDITIWRP